MSIAEIEKVALELAEQQRAMLAANLLQSLSSALSDDISRFELWTSGCES